MVVTQQGTPVGYIVRSLMLDNLDHIVGKAKYKVVNSHETLYHDRMATASKRTYGDRCGVARALDLVGERWTLLVVRELLLGPKRFTDLRAGLGAIGPDVLSQRLRDLEAAGLVRRTTLPPPTSARVYELTPRGRELEPVLLALGRFGSVAPFPAGDPGMGVDALAIALKTLFDPVRADGLDATVALTLEGQPFTLRVHDGELDLARGTAHDPDLTIAGAPGPLAAVLWHGRALRGSGVEVTGDAALRRRVLGLFPLPA
jgi:DNA-binding HxlR family transcriptional regulator